jgi:hypothetical protein
MPDKPARKKSPGRRRTPDQDEGFPQRTTSQPPPDRDPEEEGSAGRTPY